MRIYGSYKQAEKKDNDRMTMKFLLHKDKEKNEKMPTHKTAHLQTAQADTRPKFAKELFSCQRSRWNY